jgi:DNA-binding NtrC family response regulator
MWGKKKSAKVLIVSDNSETTQIVADSKYLLQCKQTKVKSCEKALRVVTGGLHSFDFLVTDMAKLNVDGADFAKEFHKLSPSTKVIYMIP